MSRNKERDDEGSEPSKCAQKIKRLLKTKHINQNALAEHLGVREARVSHWMHGTGIPNVYHGQRIAKLLGVSLDWLADDSQDEEPVAVPTDATESHILVLARLIGIQDAHRALAQLYGRMVDAAPVTSVVVAPPGAPPGKGLHPNESAAQPPAKGSKPIRGKGNA